MIQFRSVCKVHSNGIAALKTVSFDIYDGEFVFIYGAEGCGKTTVLNLILREEFPTSGEIYINGVDITKLSERDVPYLRRKIGFLFHDDKLLNNRTVRENMEFILSVTGMIKEKADRIDYVLDMLNLTGKQHSYPGELSGGERRKVAIARAYVTEPLIFLADEPASHLDTSTAEVIIKCLLDINNRGTSIVFTTSSLNIADSIGKRMIRLE